MVSERLSWHVRGLIGLGAALVLAGGSVWAGQLDGSTDRPAVQDLRALPAGTDESADTSPVPDSSDAVPEIGDPAEPSEADDQTGPPIGALITPSGIVVPAFGRVGDTYVVHTPCGVLGSVTGGVPLYGADVVLDPGHGGDVETGAQGANDLTEKDLNMAVAIAARRVLDKRGIVTVLTRTGDYRLPLATRAEIANRLDARAMISIHHNAPTPGLSDTPGTEVYIQHGSEESARLGRLVWEEAVAALSNFDDVVWATASDAGAFAVLNSEGDDTYGMVRRPLMPAVLAELGYLSNPSEAKLFATTAYVDAAGAALAAAVERFLYTLDDGEAPTPDPRVFTPAGGTGGTQGCVDPELD